jgi:predicted anti-sigma-YlaC factor YlaD
MFRKIGTVKGCSKYEARLEDCLQGADDIELSEHLRQCADCRAALDKSRLGGELLREAWEPAGEPRSAFVAGVMARIREEKVRTESPAAFWNPLEFLASRVSVTAAALLFVLAMYMVGYVPKRTPSLPTSARTELNAADFPQPPGEPDSNEEVLQSLVETDNAN